MFNILIVDDEPNQMAILRHFIAERLHYRVTMAQSGREAVERFLLRLKPQPDLVLVSALMSDVSGMEVVRTIRRSHRQLPVIMLCSQLDANLSAELVKCGCDDVLQKPLTLQRLDLAIKRQLERAALGHEVQRLQRFQVGQTSFSDIIAESPAMQAALTQAKRAVDSAIPIFIEGENGTGKELLARAIHGSSIRYGKPFIVYDAKIASALGQQALFAEKLQQAADGTLYIKRLSGLGAEEQALLHQVITGSNKVPLRLIASSSESLPALMREGLELDLARKLSGFTLQLKPLLERKEDIIPMAKHLLRHYALAEGSDIRGFAQETLDHLMTYAWPGNAAELQQAMRHAVIACDEPLVQPYHLHATIAASLDPLLVQGGGAGAFARRSLPPSFIAHDGNVKRMHELEAEVIEYAIRHYKGKMSEVARRLGIGRSTLYRKIQDYNLQHVA